MDKKYMMVTHDKFKFELTEEELRAVRGSIIKGDKFLMLHDSMVPLSIVPIILPLATWKDQENDRLATSGKRICNNCNSVRDNESRTCYTCSSRNREKELLPSTPGLYPVEYKIIPPMIPESIRKRLNAKTF